MSRAIRRLAWPALRAAGFTASTSRTAWRDLGRTIDVVTFRAAVSSQGDRLFLGAGKEATRGTFAVEIGTYFAFKHDLPFASPPVTRASALRRPAEYECDRRTRLVTSSPAPGYPEELWAVSEDGIDAEAAVASAVESLRAALAWFDHNRDLRAIFDEYRARCLPLRATIELYETIVARAVDPADRIRHDREEARRERAAAKRGRPHARFRFWHDEALRRLAILRPH